MRYLVTVKDTKLITDMGFPFLHDGGVQGQFEVVTDTTAQVELLYILTDRNEPFMQELMMKLPDQKYRLIFEEHALIGKALNKKIYKYMGYAVVDKKQDHLLFDTKYLTIGHLNALNLQKRDIQNEVRRSNWKTVQGTGDFNQLYHDVDPVNPNKPIYSYGKN